MEILIVWVVFGLMGIYIGKKKNFSLPVACVAGILMGPLSFLMLFAKGGVAQRKKCPMCSEVVQIEALVCKHCGHNFQKQNTTPPTRPQPRQQQLRVQPKQIIVQHKKAVAPPPEETVACPLCNTSLRLSSVSVGRNICPSCKGEFEAKA